MIAKSKIAWAINETTSMKRAAQLLHISYNTFKKYAKMYELFQPAPAPGRYREGGKPVELSDILAGNNPNYSTAKLQKRLCREGLLAEECANCGYDEYRAQDMTKPLMLDYLDDDQTNKDLANLRLLCYNCFYLLKMDRLGVDTPANVKSFQKAWVQAFSK
jgi:hypothetical protein|tara:strand:+ start:206 stop:688 length:483 start_codon:yes stop_codon:yes gene_type:complete